MPVPVIEPARNPGDLEAAAEVVRRVTPWTAVSAAEIEHNLKAEPRSFERWVAGILEGPGALPDGCFVALAGEEVVAYAGLSALGANPGQRSTCLRRSGAPGGAGAWRRL